MTYANWRFDVGQIADVRTTFDLDNDPGRGSDLYLQLYDAPIDGTGTYHGVQTIDLVILSRFGTVDLGEVRPAPDAFSVAGTDEGPFVSLRMKYRLGQGRFSTRLRRGEPDGDGDWFQFSVGRGGDAEETVVGSMRFPRRRRDTPASFADGGGTWTEFWDNNGPVYHEVPLWRVRIDPPVANGEAAAVGATLRYSCMPNSIIYWDPERRQVVTTIGGSTERPDDNVRSYRFE
jgi:hypothetical protein